MNLYRYAYPDSGKFEIIQVRATRRPSGKTMPRSGSWVVEELQSDGTWQMPCFPEIGWGKLSKLVYLGHEKIPSKPVLS